jgi:branched-chain amino acid transport system substrate-binding protein
MSLVKQIALLLIVLVLGAVPATAAGTASPLELYALVPITGPLAFYGQGVQQSLAAEAAVISAAGGVRGRDVHITVLDDQANPQTAVQLISPLLAKNVPVIIDAGPAATCRATAALAKSAAVIFCLSTAFRPEVDSYSFTTPFSLEAGIAVQVRYFRNIGLKRLGFVIATDATGQEVDNVLSTVLAYPENKDVIAVARERFSPADISVSAQIARIGNAKPQAVFAFGSGTPLGLIFNAMRDAGMALPTATLAVNQSVKQLVSYGAIVPADLEMVTPRWAAYDVMGAGPVKTKVGAFRAAMERAGLGTDGPDSLAWDPLMLILDGYRKLGDAPSTSGLRDYIAGLRNIAGICGFYDFPTTPGRGLTSKDTVVLRWNAAKKTFDPISTAGGAARLPG